MKRVGQLAEIIRHPVKALKGERIPSSQVDAFGLYGDRSYYFLDNSRTGKFLCADRAPRMLGYQAQLVGEAAEGTYPAVRITSPEGKQFSWDEDFHQEMETITKLPLTAMMSTPEKGGVNWEDHILLVTDASLRKMASMCGRELLDHRRFRANLVIALDDDLPFVEEEWFGKQLKINDVVLQVNKHCKRCVYINIDPTDLSIDPVVLKTVVKERSQHFGVYASVIQPGSISEKDEVLLL